MNVHKRESEIDRKIDLTKGLFLTIFKKVLDFKIILC